MKKDPQKKLIKTARKTAQKSIKLKLITELEKAVGTLGKGSKKIIKEIDKVSGHLAKKLSKELEIDKSTIVKAVTKTKIPKVIAKETAPGTDKPKAAPAKKAETVATKPVSGPTKSKKSVKPVK
jgi:hypothetical protein